MKTALVAGATGLVGSQLLSLLLSDDRYEKVIAISRRPLPGHPKLKNVIAGFPEIEKAGAELTADDIFCCLGTTIKQAKTKEAFRAIDFDYAVALARLGAQHGATQFLLVSALGANKHSSIFYNRVKGEAEEAVAAVGLNRLVILRPSLLLGDRAERRPAEIAATKVYRLLDFLIPKTYKAIESARVARALLALAVTPEAGKFIYESSALQKY